jgi:hypothetical protein
MSKEVSVSFWGVAGFGSALEKRIPTTRRIDKVEEIMISSLNVDTNRCRLISGKHNYSERVEGSLYTWFPLTHNGFPPLNARNARAW